MEDSLINNKNFCNLVQTVRDGSTIGTSHRIPGGTPAVAVQDP